MMMMMQSLTRNFRQIISFTIRPALDALWYGRHLPWAVRWRLLAFQPLHFLTNLMCTVPNLFRWRLPYTVDYIPVPTPAKELRVLVFKHSNLQTTPGGRLRPLHIDCHPGGFVGGLPEAHIPLCEHIAAQTGAVVVSLSHRFAPVHPFPAPIDDVDAAVSWLLRNATERYGADPSIVTVSGASAGGTLMLAATQAAAASGTIFEAYTGFYPPLDLRPAPWEKPRPQGPSIADNDPMAFMERLFDSYAAPRKADMSDDPRMSPCLAHINTLPKRMLLVVPRIDILPKEILEFAERVKRDDEQSGDTSREVKVVWLEDMFHGFLEVPNAVVPLKRKMDIFDQAVAMIQEAHQERGWSWKL